MNKNNYIDDWTQARVDLQIVRIAFVLSYAQWQQFKHCKADKVNNLTKYRDNTAPFTRVCPLSICITQEDHMFRRSEFLSKLSTKTSGLIDLLI